MSCATTASTSADLPFIDNLPKQHTKPAKSNRPRMPKQQNDPKRVAAARELRDRHLEQLGPVD